ncbi:putative ABC transport system permease protein [Cryobacterium sp. CAN_C3]|uniref:ABC transporter permease n=1 Tax=unclassified Cryobacterium TaxID=2649013 RepID=UPI0018CB6131|nr:FtsX-like permease family protein [Cryobacterium sp. CAN_C3]MEC5155424.1 putative ABC transport system permease protein [Cryobacterium sp. CAN_C3]
MSWIWLHGLLTRRTGVLAATVTGVAIAVALLASLGSFLVAAQSSMTQRAASGVAVDWQVQIAPGSDVAALIDKVRAAPGVTKALPVGFAHSSGFVATTNGSTQTTGQGVVLGLPDGYAAAFPGEIRYLAGSHEGVLVAQQTAANLHVAPGDTVSIGLDGARAIDVTIDGVVDLPQANSLFQTVGAPAQSQPNAPPDNVLLLPPAGFTAVRAALSTARPDLLSTQVHVSRASALPEDPAVAFVAETAAAHNLEAQLAGAGQVGDNLGAALDAARGDSSYATLLFLFLGLPGAVLCGILTVAVANAGAERRRRDQALLRTRGASARLIARFVTVEALVVGVIGGLIGLGVAVMVGFFAFGIVGFGNGLQTAVLWPLAAFLVGLFISLGAILIPALRDFRTLTVSDARAQVLTARRPWWERAYIDVVLLIVAAVVVFITTRDGYSLVLAPEGVASIQVNYWAFFGPGLFWIGAGLLIWRLTDVVLGRGRPAITRLLRPISGNLSGVAAASMSRQRSVLARSTVVLALALAFAGSTSIFNATYQQQAEVDAQLTNGADVTVTEPPGSSVAPNAASGISQIAGVVAVEPLQHRFAYVGSDLQDLFGVNADTITRATSLQDAYFQGGTATELMGRLATQPDAILVSDETVKDFQLSQGDLINLRLSSGQTHQLVTVPFHYVGIAKEFPTAPKDSFFIANAAYVAQSTADNAVGSFLVSTGGSHTEAVATALRDSLGTTATVTAIGEARSSVGSSLTSVDLAGLTRVELIFALILATAAGGLVFALGLAERRRSFAIATALGASRKQLRALVLSEAASTAVGGVVAGIVVGWLLSQMLVSVLTGVFDPPPAALAIPWGYLAATAVIALGAIETAAMLSIRRTSKPTIEYLREL